MVLFKPLNLWVVPSIWEMKKPRFHNVTDLVNGQTRVLIKVFQPDVMLFPFQHAYLHSTTYNMY